MWKKALCTFIVLLLAIQPGQANWWEDKQLWPSKFEPWQSYVVRQREWNKNEIYGSKESFIKEQRRYGTLCHKGAEEAVALFNRKADFFEVLSFLGHVRFAIAMRLNAKSVTDPFGVERCVVSRERHKHHGGEYNHRENSWLSKEEVDRFESKRGCQNKPIYITPLGGQYAQAALQLSQSRYRQPYPLSPSFCRTPKHNLIVSEEQYEILTPSKTTTYTQIIVLNHAIIEHSLKTSLDEGACFGYIFHSDEKIVPDLLSKLKDLYEAILGGKYDKKQIATFQYLFAHAMPYARGSAAVGTIFSNAFYIYHGMENAITPARVGVVVDIEALSTPLEDFLDAYPSFFEAK